MPNIVDHDTNVKPKTVEIEYFGGPARDDICRQLNMNQAQTFLSLLAGDEPVTFQTFPDRKDDPSASSSLTRILHGTLEDHAEQLIELNSRGAGVFVMVNQGDCKGRKAPNVVAVRALFVDLDGSPLEPVMNGALRPQIFLETSPGRYHAYWKVNGIELNEFPLLQEELALRFGGDPQVKDLPRVMRLPGFFHRKATPFPVRLIEANTDQPYSRDEFFGAFDIDPALMQTDRVSKCGRMVECGTPSIPFKNTRHQTILTIGGLLRRNGYSAEEIELALKALNNGAFGEPEDEAEIEYQARDMADRYDPASDYIKSEVGLAQQFVKRHGLDFIYCHGLGGWQMWDGKRWRRDVTNSALMSVQENIRTLITLVKNAPFSEQKSRHLNFLVRSETAARCKAILCLSQPYLDKSPDEFDGDRFLLNVANGTLDLRTGTLREHRREDYITKIADIDYDPEAKSDLFGEFLAGILSGDAELIGFVKRAFGYSLTGDISEQCWFVNYGTGSNGKTTLYNLVLHVLGEYGAQTPADTFLASMSDRIRNDLARLSGCRLIVASEPDESRRLDSSLIKAFTGGDRITARFLHKEYFEYIPSGKLFLLCNHQPSVRANDHGFWRRVRLIPFGLVVPDEAQDKHLESKLRAEAPGILRFMVEGCLDWQRNGLRPPNSVVKATRDYQEEMDVLRDFLTDPMLVIDQEKVVAKADLYEYYAARYCAAKGLKPLSNEEFNRLMTAKNFKTARRNKNRRRCWVGIGLVTPTP